MRPTPEFVSPQEDRAVKPIKSATTSPLRLPNGRWATFIAAASLAAANLLFQNSATAAIGPGTAPVDPPFGGFAIDGDLEANNPVAGIGDWVPGLAGLGDNVLTASGGAINPGITIHLTDKFNDSTDNTFGGGLKGNDNPNLWNWVSGSANDKTDINNALIHLTKDADGHIWLVVAADRRSNGGNAWIDFEFLQNSLTLTTNSSGTAGGFVSAAPAGTCGRTVNDFTLTVAFTGGGATPDFSVARWQAVSGGGAPPCGYDYVNGTVPSGAVFAAVNSGIINVPYPAFGSSQYQPGTFIEGAIDLTAMVTGFDPCLSIGIKSLLVKTKTAASSSAGVVDFIVPQQFSVTLGVANAGLDQTKCQADLPIPCADPVGPKGTQFDLIGVATPSTGQTVASASWSVISGNATICPPANGLTATAYVSSPTATLRFTVVTDKGCTSTDEVVLTVTPPSDCLISGPEGPVCPNSTGNTFKAAAAASYSWSITGNGSIDGPVDAQTVNVKAGSLCDNDFTLSLTTKNADGCSNICTKTVRVQDLLAPVIAALPDPTTINCPATPVFAVATAIDACGSAFTLTSEDVTTPGVCAGSYSVTRTWTAKDACGNSSTASQTINVQDVTAPVIAALPDPTTINCPATPMFAVATATDACGSAFTLTSKDVTTPGNCAGSYSVTRTWTATDACGNSSTASQTINVQDVTAPVIAALPAPTTINCPATPVFAVATATDECGSAFTLTSADATTPGDCAGSYSVTRTWTAKDACGNTSTASQTIRVQDVTAPVIAPLPGPTTINCPATPVFAVATATDECGSAFTLKSKDVTTPGDCAGSYSVTRTWTATDDCGNSSTASQTIRVQDVTAPVIATLPGPTTINCPATPNFAQATATDECSSAFTLTSKDVTTPGACAGSYSVTRTWTAKDDCGNSSTASQTIHVQDITAPVIAALPAPTTINCPATPVFAQATATDECGSAFTLTSKDVTTPGACAGSYSVTRTWTAKDACGNSSTASQTINVQDVTAPVIATLPGPTTINCPATPNFAQATATDACGSAVTLTSKDTTTPGNCPGAYSVTRTWTATDACGNSSTASQTISVRDITAPVISTLPGPTTITCLATPVFAQASATDACDPSITLTFNDVTTLGSCPGSYSVTRTWTATDRCGNISKASQTINVQDTTAPVITGVGGPQIAECPASPVFSQPTATDTCDPQATLTYADRVEGPEFCNTNPGTLNASGNGLVRDISVFSTGLNATDVETFRLEFETNQGKGRAEFTLISPSGEAIILVGPHCTGSGFCDDSSSATQEAYQPTFYPCASGFPKWNNFDNIPQGPGKFSPFGFDANASAEAADIAVVVPRFTGVYVTCFEQLKGPMDGTWTVYARKQKSVNGNIAYISACLLPRTCPGTQRVTRTWTATDACGNSSQASQTVTVKDTTGPVISPLPAPTTVNCPATPSFAVATATDACDPNAKLTFKDVTTPGNCPGTYSVTRTWTAVDACGNTSTASQTISVIDNTPPVISGCPAAPIDLGCNPTQLPSCADALSLIKVTDACAGPIAPVCNAGVVVADGCLRTQKFVLTATDACNNTAQCQVTYQWKVDVTPPVILCPKDLVIYCGDPNLSSAIATWLASVSASDNDCGLVGVANDLTSAKLDALCNGGSEVVVSFLATDSCGNTASCTAKIVTPTVKGRWVFYNNSFFDGLTPGADVLDDSAIAPDKSALLPGGVATFANYTSYRRGLNGIMIDIAHLPEGTPTLGDFEFKAGNDQNPAAWASAPAPVSVTVRRGAGVGGSDRITLIWNDNNLDLIEDANEATAKRWLQVTVKGTANSGLAHADTFYFGNAVGETGNSPLNAQVTTADALRVLNNVTIIPNISSLYDINRDGKVTTADYLVVINNVSAVQPLILLNLQ